MPADETDDFEALVVGAGPAGIAAVGNLIENNIGPVCWVDKSFDGGRLHKYYREVPANLKAKGFVQFATSLQAFKSVLNVDTPANTKTPPNNHASRGFHAMCGLPQEEECALSYGADMCLELTQGLVRQFDVSARQGRVTRASLDQPAGRWHVILEHGGNRQPDESIVTTKRFILCTGSSPLELPYNPTRDTAKILPLDTALSPTALRDELLHQPSSLTVLVLGSSHSAILVLKNLKEVARVQGKDLKIKWIYCKEPLYAEWADGKYIARDNTGLKGEAAVWAKKHLCSEVADEQHIEKIRVERRLDLGDLYHHSFGADMVVQALGFKADPLPVMRHKSNGRIIEPQFDHVTGGFVDLVGKTPSRVPGLYGAGIAFPSLHWDEKYQFWEHAIGFPAFMRALKAWAPTWKSVSGSLETEGGIYET